MTINFCLQLMRAVPRPLRAPICEQLDTRLGPFNGRSTSGPTFVGSLQLVLLNAKTAPPPNPPFLSCKGWVIFDLAALPHRPIEGQAHEVFRRRPVKPQIIASFESEPRIIAGIAKNHASGRVLGAKPL